MSPASDSSRDRQYEGDLLDIYAAFEGRRLDVLKNFMTEFGVLPLRQPVETNVSFAASVACEGVPEIEWITFHNLEEAFEFALLHPDAAFSVYLDASEPDCRTAVISFTADGSTVVGLSQDALADSATNAGPHIIFSEIGTRFDTSRIVERMRDKLAPRRIVAILEQEPPELVSDLEKPPYSTVGQRLL